MNMDIKDEKNMSSPERGGHYTQRHYSRFAKKDGGRTKRESAKHRLMQINDPDDYPKQVRDPQRDIYALSGRHTGGVCGTP
jgi:hypothetical protein